MLYPTTAGRFYIRVKDQSVWLTPELKKRLSRFCRFKIFRPARPKPQPVWRLEHRRIVFHTADRDLALFPNPSHFAVPLQFSDVAALTRPGSHAHRSGEGAALGMPRPRIMGIRLHSAVIPRTRTVFSSARGNDTILVRVGLSEVEVNLPSSIVKASAAAAHIQQEVRAGGVAELEEFTCSFVCTTGSLRMSNPAAAFTIEGTALAVLGFRDSLESSEEGLLSGGGVDFSGSRYLHLHAAELRGHRGAVACVPLHDPLACGLVYYTNPEAGGDPRAEYASPICLTRLTFTVLDDWGQPYDFRGLNSCYVLEITCADARPPPPQQPHSSISVSTS